MRCFTIDSNLAVQNGIILTKECSKSWRYFKNNYKIKVYNAKNDVLFEAVKFDKLNNIIYASMNNKQKIEDNGIIVQTDFNFDIIDTISLDGSHNVIYCLGYIKCIGNVIYLPQEDSSIIIKKDSMLLEIGVGVFFEHGKRPLSIPEITILDE